MIKATTIGGLTVDNQSVNHLKISDIDDLDDFIDRCKMQGYYEITKQMFDEFFIENTKYINEISKL